MKLENHTGYSNGQIREYINFCKPAGVSNFRVVIRESKHLSFSGLASYWKNQINLRVPINKTLEYPRMREPKNWYRTSKGYLPMLILSWEEDFINYLAHELRHLHQFEARKRNKREHRVWGARGRFSERDADAYALRKVREWRAIKREVIV